MIDEKRWIKISIKKLVPADWNYKEDDDEKLRKLMNNLKRIGQVENILIRKLETGFYEVINGNHRLKGFRLLKVKKAICYNFGKISDAQARRIAVETNETKFDSDKTALAGLIKEITEEDFDIEELAETMPFDTDQLESMRELLEFNWEDEGDEENEEDEDNKKDEILKCPECGHQWAK